MYEQNMFIYHNRSLYHNIILILGSHWKGNGALVFNNGSQGRFGGR